MKSRFYRKRCTATQALAAQIASVLFKSGLGTHAKRLVMVDEKGRDLGGWCVQAVQDQIENQLLASRRRKTRR